MAVSACEPEAFRTVIGHLAAGVTVLTTTLDGTRLGMTASAVTSLSLEPPMLLACVNRRSPTGQAIARTGLLGVSILSESQGTLASRFAAASDDRFAGVDVVDGALGVPLLGAALARLECRVVEQVPGGTHTVFLAEVLHAEAGAGSPLAYFRGRFGRLDVVEDEAVHEPTVDDALDGRRAIERGVAELTVGRVGPGDLAELRALMEATVPLVAGGRFTDVSAYAFANARFHERMIAFAGSDGLVQAYRRLALPGIIARAFGPHSAADAALADDHRELVEGYEAGDLARVVATVDRHVERAKALHRAAP
jgi:flavin reductase (DIM6/NTAB) family NADH-FMN oxidoreductase RutF